MALLVCVIFSSSISFWPDLEDIFQDSSRADQSSVRDLMSALLVRTAAQILEDESRWGKLRRTGEVE